MWRAARIMESGGAMRCGNDGFQAPQVGWLAAVLSRWWKSYPQERWSDSARLLDRSNHLSVLELHVWLLDDRLAAVQSSLHVDGVAEIATNGHLLKAQLAIWIDEHDLGAIGVENQRSGWQVPAL